MPIAHVSKRILSLRHLCIKLNALRENPLNRVFSQNCVKDGVKDRPWSRSSNRPYLILLHTVQNHLRNGARRDSTLALTQRGCQSGIAGGSTNSFGLAAAVRR